MKYCRCAKGKNDEEYIECPFYNREYCPCQAEKCIIYKTYANSDFIKDFSLEVDKILEAKKIINK